MTTDERAAPLSADELAELERLCEAATVGPWVSQNDAIPWRPRQRSPFSSMGASVCGADGSYVVEGGLQDEQGGAVGVLCNEDAALIAASRTAMPHLLTDLRQARAELGRLRAAVDIAERGWNNQVRYSDAYQKRAEQAEAEVARLTTAVEQARELLAELLDETGLKACYTLADGGLHPGATSTIAAVWRFLWPAPATAAKEQP